MGKSLKKSNFRRLASFCSAIESFWADEDALHMAHHYRAKGVSNCFDVESIFDCLLIVTDSSVLLTISASESRPSSRSLPWDI